MACLLASSGNTRDDMVYVPAPYLPEINIQDLSLYNYYQSRIKLLI